MPMPNLYDNVWRRHARSGAMPIKADLRHDLAALLICPLVSGLNDPKSLL